MKLLLDQNLSRKLVNSLTDLFPESCHLTSVLPENSDDRTIWNYAREAGFTILTKDDDFEQRSILYGHPPKVIWIRLGNCKTEDVAILLRRSAAVLLAFSEDNDKSILPIP